MILILLISNNCLVGIKRKQLRCSCWTLKLMNGRLQLIVYYFKRSLAGEHLEQFGEHFWGNQMEKLGIGLLLQNALHVRSRMSTKTNCMSYVFFSVLHKYSVGDTNVFVLNLHTLMSSKLKNLYTYSSWREVLWE